MSGLVLFFRYNTSINQSSNLDNHRIDGSPSLGTHFKTTSAEAHTLTAATDGSPSHAASHFHLYDMLYQLVFIHLTIVTDFDFVGALSKLLANGR